MHSPLFFRAPFSPPPDEPFYRRGFTNRMATPKAHENRHEGMTRASPVATSMPARRVPFYSPCLACGSKESIATNRPLSYHLKKGLRKHLPSGICYRTERGKQGELPPLATITDGSCMCLACVKIIDTLLATLDKMPLRNGSQHAPIVRPLAPVKTLVKPKRRIPAAPRNANVYGNATTSNVNMNGSMNTNNNNYTPIMPNSHSIPNTTKTSPPKSAPTPTTGVCIICNLSSAAPSPLQPGSKEISRVSGCTLAQIRDQVIEKVGNHLSTLESTVRIFRATRVELAEGVCTFDSRAFATHLLNGAADSIDTKGIICTLHHNELLRAADVKAAGALPCAICGDKPTLSGGDEVRSLASFIVHHQNFQDGNAASNGTVNPNVLCDAAIVIMKTANILPVANFPHQFHAFLEKEFACSQCHRALEEKL